ncbi:hypothetical protein GC173_00735 [bacterium]|nr:hypothetical protein [bacterium]
MKSRPPLPDDPDRPGRIELFTFYYLGFNPDGEYRWANAHHVGRYYRVSSDAVLRWLEELDLDPKRMLHQQFDLSSHQVDLQLEAPDLTPAEIYRRASAILEELDAAPGGRKPWEENG